MSVDEQRIRELAYQIWQSEGCPEGQDDRHWQMACRLAEAELQQSAAANKPSRGRKSAATPVETSAPGAPEAGIPAAGAPDGSAPEASLLADEATEPAMAPPLVPEAKPRVARSRSKATVSAAAALPATDAEGGTPAAIKKPRAPRKKKE